MAHGYAAAGHDFGRVPVVESFAVLPPVVLSLLARTSPLMEKGRIAA